VTGLREHALKREIVTVVLEQRHAGVGSIEHVGTEKVSGTIRAFTRDRQFLNDCGWPTEWFLTPFYRHMF
jgi:hypothetical protein